MINKHLKIYLALLVLLLMFMPTQVFAISIGDSISNSINVFNDEEEEVDEEDPPAAEEPATGEPTEEPVEEAPVEEPADVQGPSSVGPGQQIMDPTIEQNFVNQQNIVVMDQGYQSEATKWIPDTIEVEPLDNGTIAATTSQYNGYQDYGFISELSDQWLTESAASMNATPYEYQETEMLSVSNYTIEDIDAGATNVVFYFSGPQNLSNNELAVIATVCNYLIQYYMDEGYSSTILMINEILQGSYTHSAEQQAAYEKELTFLANLPSFYVSGVIVYEDVFYEFYSGLEIFRATTGEQPEKGEPTAESYSIPGAAPQYACADNTSDTSYRVYYVYNSLDFIYYNGDDYGYKKLIAPDGAFPGGSYQEGETASCGYFAVDLTYDANGWNKNSGDVIRVSDSTSETNSGIHGDYVNSSYTFTGEKAMIDAIIYSSEYFLSGADADYRAVAATCMIHQMIRGSANYTDNWSGLKTDTKGKIDVSYMDTHVDYVANMADDYYNNVKNNGGWKSTECIYNNETDGSASGSQQDVTARPTNFYNTYQKYPSIDVSTVTINDTNVSGGSDTYADINEELVITVGFMNYSTRKATIDLSSQFEGGEYQGSWYGFSESGATDYGDCVDPNDVCTLKGDNRNPHAAPSPSEYKITFKIKTSAIPDSNWNSDTAVTYYFDVASADSAYSTDTMLRTDSEKSIDKTMTKATNKAPTMSNVTHITSPADAPSDPLIQQGLSASDPEEGSKSFVSAYGNGFFVTSTGGYVSGGNNPPGTYTIKYKVCDSSATTSAADKCSGEYSRNITITSQPVITVPGNVIVNKGYAYSAKTGVTCDDNGTNCSNSVTYTSTGGDGYYNGDGTDAPGVYTITYKYTNAQGSAAVNKTRTITVNAPPTITPPPPPANMSSYGNVVIDEGTVINVLQLYSAFDPEDGNISSKLYISSNANNFKGDGTDAVGSYPMTFCVEDNSTTAIPSAPKGSKTCINQIIYVNDSPLITTPGNVVVNAGHPYDAKTGINCSDLELGASCTNDIVVTSAGGDGTYNGDGTDAPGTYTITYKYTDSNGMTTTTTRTIRVNAYPTITKPAPPTNMSGYGDIIVNEGEVVDIASKYSANDLEDGVLTSEIFITNNTNNFKGDGTDIPGAYPISICVEDHETTAIPSAPNGAQTCINQVVYVNDLPVITTNGDIIVNEGHPYDALTAVTCVDLETPDCTSGLAYTSTGGDGSYNGDGTDKPGTYTITYQVTDGNNYTSTATSTIRVNAFPTITAPPPPENMGEYGDIIVNEGDSHPILEGFMADDLEDGDITSNLYVASNQNNYVGDGTDAPGAYPITVCAEDNETEAIPTAPDGAETCVNKKIYVNGEPTLTIPGDIVVNAGHPFSATNGVLCNDLEAPNGDCTSGVSYTSTGGDGTYNGDGTDAPGVYEITYHYSDANGFEGTGMRNIRVNAYPTITEPAEPINMVGYGDIVVNEGEVVDVPSYYTADDLEDGDISNKITFTSSEGFVGDGTDAPGAYDIEICVEDNETTAIPSAPNGAETCINQVIYVNARPQITTPAADPIVVPENYPYDVMTNVIAEDLEDGDITLNVDVDTAFIGNGNALAGKTYDVTYTVADANNFSNTVTKQIYVDANPVIEMPNGITFEEGEPIDLHEVISGSDLENEDFEDTLTVDNKDGLKGDGTDPVGDYDITVCGTDSTGLIFCEDFVIRIITNNKPVQQLPATYQVTIFEGDVYNLNEEIVIYDHEDGYIDETITENEKVGYPTLYFKGDGTDSEGTFIIEYTAIDSSDNVLNGEVIIEVVEAPANGEALNVTSESYIDVETMNAAMFEANGVNPTEVTETTITNETGAVVDEAALISIDKGSYTVTTEYVDENNEAKTFSYDVVAEDAPKQPLRDLIRNVCDTISDFVTNLVN